MQSEIVSNFRKVINIYVQIGLIKSIIIEGTRNNLHCTIMHKNIDIALIPK